MEDIDSYKIKQTLDRIKRDIRRDWDIYKKSRQYLSDEEIRDNTIDMVLLFFIKRGFFDDK